MGFVDMVDTVMMAFTPHSFVDFLHAGRVLYALVRFLSFRAGLRRYPLVMYNP